VINLDRHDWIEAIETFDAVIWLGSHTSPRYAAFYSEKIYFIETFLGKKVIPNFATSWHYESKVAQSYLFKHIKARIPRTMVSFDYEDSLEQLSQAKLPLVFKRSEGAASRYVRLVKDLQTGRKLIQQIFNQYLWDKARMQTKSRTALSSLNLYRPWFLAHLIAKIRQEEGFGVVYWQDFIPGNDADLKVEVIGDRYAYAFWRHNRDNDFRASGSGKIDYESNVPEDVLLHLFHLNREMGFDSMGYDILFDGSQFLISEMSFSYDDNVPYQGKGYYELDDNEKLTFNNGHFWPQELWIDWLLRKVGLAKSI